MGAGTTSFAMQGNDMEEDDDEEGVVPMDIDGINAGTLGAAEPAEPGGQANKMPRLPTESAQALLDRYLNPKWVEAVNKAIPTTDDVRKATQYQWCVEIDEGGVARARCLTHTPHHPLSNNTTHTSHHTRTITHHQHYMLP